MTIKDWWTDSNNPSLSKSEYLYNSRHIFVLILTVILCVCLTLVFRKKSVKTKQIMFNVFGYIFLILEVLSRIVNLIILESYTFENILKIILPMHICSVMVWVFIFAIFTKKQFLINFSVVGGILATLAFLLYPAVGLNKVYMSFTCLYSTISHMLGFVCAVLLISLGKTKFNFKDMWKTYLCLFLMFCWGAILNFLIFPGSDYMYMRNDPLELNLNFPYQVLYIFILIVYVFIYYFIAWIKRIIKTARKEI